MCRTKQRNLAKMLSDEDFFLISWLEFYLQVQFGIILFYVSPNDFLEEFILKMKLKDKALYHTSHLLLLRHLTALSSVQITVFSSRTSDDLHCGFFQVWFFFCNKQTKSLLLYIVIGTAQQFQQCWIWCVKNITR